MGLAYSLSSHSNVPISVGRGVVTTKLLGSCSVSATPTCYIKGDGSSWSHNWIKTTIK